MGEEIFFLNVDFSLWCKLGIFSPFLVHVDILKETFKNVYRRLLQYYNK